MLSKNGKTFDLRALGGIFVENLDGGQFILLYDRGTKSQILDLIWSTD